MIYTFTLYIHIQLTVWFCDFEENEHYFISLWTFSEYLVSINKKKTITINRISFNLTKTTKKIVTYEIQRSIYINIEEKTSVRARWWAGIETEMAHNLALTDGVKVLRVKWLYKQYVLRYALLI